MKLLKDSYTSGEVAKILSIPDRTARRYLKNGRIVADQNPVTGTWTVKREILLDFMRKQNLDSVEIEGPLRIMLVDDDPIVLKVMAKALERLKSELVVEAISNPYDALVRLGIAAPDLLALDLHMPGIDGKQILAAVKRNENTQDIKVLIVSGFPEEVHETRLAGADDALIKPFTLDEFADKVRRLLPNGVTRMAASP